MTGDNKKDSKLDICAIVTAYGDASVGIPTLNLVVELPPEAVDDMLERSRLRMEIGKLYHGICDDGRVGVHFSDECADCHSRVTAGMPHLPDCPSINPHGWERKFIQMIDSLYNAFLHAIPQISDDMKFVVHSNDDNSKYEAPVWNEQLKRHILNQHQLVLSFYNDKAIFGWLQFNPRNQDDGISSVLDYDADLIWIEEWLKYWDEGV